MIIASLEDCTGASTFQVLSHEEFLRRMGRVGASITAERRHSITSHGGCIDAVSLALMSWQWLVKTQTPVVKHYEESKDRAGDRKKCDTPDAQPVAVVVINFEPDDREVQVERPT